MVTVPAAVPVQTALGVVESATFVSALHDASTVFAGKLGDAGSCADRVQPLQLPFMVIVTVMVPVAFVAVDGSTFGLSVSELLLRVRPFVHASG